MNLASTPPSHQTGLKRPTLPSLLHHEGKRTSCLGEFLGTLFEAGPTQQSKEDVVKPDRLNKLLFVAQLHLLCRLGVPTGESKIKFLAVDQRSHFFCRVYFTHLIKWNMVMLYK